MARAVSHHPGAPDAGTEAAADTADRITQAALICFQKHGVDNTPMAKIAEQAGVSRQTVYRYFPTKLDMIEHIGEIESLRVREEVRAQLAHHTRFDDRLTFALLLVIRTASRNACLQYILGCDEFVAHASDVRSRYHALQKQLWGSLLTTGMSRGHIAKDLQLDEIVSWLTISCQSLLVKATQTAIDDASLERILRRFVVQPLLARTPPPAKG